MLSKTVSVIEKCDLTNTSFLGSILRGSTFKNCKLMFANFSKCDFGLNGTAPMANAGSNNSSSSVPPPSSEQCNFESNTGLTHAVLDEKAKLFYLPSAIAMSTPSIAAAAVAVANSNGINQQQAATSQFKIHATADAFYTGSVNGALDQQLHQQENEDYCDDEPEV